MAPPVTGSRSESVGAAAKHETDAIPSKRDSAPKPTAGATRAHPAAGTLTSNDPIWLPDASASGQSSVSDMSAALALFGPPATQAPMSRATSTAPARDVNRVNNDVNQTSGEWKHRLDERLKNAREADDFIGILAELTHSDLQNHVISDHQNHVIDRAILLSGDEFNKFVGAQKIQNDPALHLAVTKRLLFHTDHVGQIPAYRSRLSRVAGEGPDAELQKEVATRCATGALTLLSKFHPRQRSAFIADLPAMQRFALSLADKPNPTLKQMVAVLQSKSSNDERDILDHLLAAYSRSAFDKIEALAELLQDNSTPLNAGTRSIFGQLLLKRIVHIAESDGSATRARALALDFLRAMKNDAPSLGHLLAQLKPKEAAYFAQALDQDEVDDRLPSSFSEGELISDSRLNNPNILATARNQVLAALNMQANNASINAIVVALHASTSLLDLRQRKPELAVNLGIALARAQYPNDAPKAFLEGVRLGNLLTINEGAAFICSGSDFKKDAALQAFFYDQAINKERLDYGGSDQGRAIVTKAMTHVIVASFREANPKISLAPDAEARLADILALEWGPKLLLSDHFIPPVVAQALTAILTYPEITAESFKTAKGPWPRELQNVIAQTYAAMDAAHYPTLTPAPIPNKIALANMVGSIFGRKPPPHFSTGMQPEQIATQLKQAWHDKNVPAFASEHNFFDGDKDIDTVLTAIGKIAGDKFPVNVRLVSATVFNDNYGPIKCPVFEIKTHENGMDVYRYVTNIGAIYDNTLENEKDESGRERMVAKAAYDNWKNSDHLPAGMLWVDGHCLGKTKAERDGTDTIDKIAEVGGLVGGVGLVTVTGGSAAIAFTAAVGTSSTWLAARNGGEIIWRAKHGLSINPLNNRDALRLWLTTFTQGMTAANMANIIGAPLIRALVDIGTLSASTAKKATGALHLAGGIFFAGDMIEQGVTAIEENKLTPDLALSMAFLGLSLAPKSAPQSPKMGIEPGEPRPPETPGPETGPKVAPLPKAKLVERRWTGQSAGLIAKMRAFFTSPAMREILTRLGLKNPADKIEADLGAWADTQATPPTAEQVRAKIMELAKAHKNNLGETNIRGLQRALEDPLSSSSQDHTGNGSQTHTGDGSQARTRDINFGARPQNDNAPVNPHAQEAVGAIAANGDDFTPARSEHTVSTELDPTKTRGAASPPSGGNGGGSGTPPRQGLLSNLWTRIFGSRDPAPASKPPKPTFSQLPEREQRQHVKAMIEIIEGELQRIDVIREIKHLIPRGGELRYFGQLLGKSKFDGNDNFNKLLPETQYAILRQIHNHIDSPTAIYALSRMTGRQWFLDQTPADQQLSAKLIAGVGGKFIVGVKSKAASKVPLWNIVDDIIFDKRNGNPRKSRKVRWIDPENINDNAFFEGGGPDIYWFNKNAVPADNEPLPKDLTVKQLLVQPPSPKPPPTAIVIKRK